MRKVQTLLVIAGLLFSVTAFAEKQQARQTTKKVEPSQHRKALVTGQISPSPQVKVPGKIAPVQSRKALIKGQISQSRQVPGKIAPLPQDLEIQLALSALPPHLQENATVHVLNPQKGFEVARKGTNGFHTLVARNDESLERGSQASSEYRDDILIPISFDSAGARAHMQIIFDMAKLQAMGTTPADLKKVMTARQRTGYYKTPQRVGVSYMLSPILRTYLNPDGSGLVGTINMPHVMYYAPNVSNADIGGAKPTSMYPFVIMAGSHGYIIQRLGVTETAAITTEYEKMLASLCKIKEAWCLPKGSGQH